MHARTHCNARLYINVRMHTYTRIYRYRQHKRRQRKHNREQRVWEKDQAIELQNKYRTARKELDRKREERKAIAAAQYDFEHNKLRTFTGAPESPSVSAVSIAAAAEELTAASSFSALPSQRTQYDEDFFRMFDSATDQEFQAAQRNTKKETNTNTYVAGKRGANDAGHGSRHNKKLGTYIGKQRRGKGRKGGRTDREQERAKNTLKYRKSGWPVMMCRKCLRECRYSLKEVRDIFIYMRVYMLSTCTANRDERWRTCSVR